MELTYGERIDMDETAIQAWISAKGDLGVFAPNRASERPDDSAGDIVRELRARFPNFGSDENDSS